MKPARRGRGSILEVSKQRVGQLAQRDDFSATAKVIGRHRLWRGRDVERWRDAKPRVWAPTETPG